jgi:hypothetical protein
LINVGVRREQEEVRRTKSLAGETKAELNVCKGRRLHMDEAQEVPRMEAKVGAEKAKAEANRAVYPVVPLQAYIYLV